MECCAEDIPTSFFPSGIDAFKLTFDGLGYITGIILEPAEINRDIRDAA